MSTAETLTLRDGRVLAYARYGADGGTPLFYFSGTMGSRLEALFLDEPAKRLGISIASVDRPGHGLSSAHPGRSFASFAEDVRELADALGWQRFAVSGLSGGGAHAAAVASVLRERITRVLLVSAAGPPDAPGVSKTRALPIRFFIALARWTVLHLWFVAAVLGFVVRRRGPAMFEKPPPGSPPGDVRALQSPAFRRALAEGWAEGTRSGGRGVAIDLAVQLRPWNVTLAPIEAPVDLWYGHRDNVTPPAIARHYATIWPHANLTLLDDEGHLLIGGHADEILAPLADARRETRTA